MERRERELKDASERKERELTAAQAAREEARRRQLQMQQIAQANLRANLIRLIWDAQEAAAKLPLLLAKAEQTLERAEREFSDGTHSPFWEAMELAVEILNDFHTILREIGRAQLVYANQAALLDRANQELSIESDVPAFSLGVTVLPDSSVATQRMKALYRSAQKNPGYAQVYEQRRTNSILIEGFRTLGDAFLYFGDRLESELNALGSQLNLQLVNIEAALADSAQQLEWQHGELLENAQSWREEAREGAGELITIANTTANRFEDHARKQREQETETRKMLDNIQHRRRPFK